jgi:hypothetical protein
MNQSSISSEAPWKRKLAFARLQAQTAAYQTARMAYAKALQSALPAMPASDTLKFN